MMDPERARRDVERGQRLYSRLQEQVAARRERGSTEALEGLEEALGELGAILEELSAQNDELASARASLTRMRQRLRDLFELAPDPYVVTDLRGNITEVNGVFQAKFGRSKDSVIGKPLAVLLDGAAHGDLNRKLTSLRDGAAAHVDSWEVRFAPGPAIAFPAALSASLDAPHPPASVYWVVRDVSARKRAETDLRKSQERLLLAVGATGTGVWDGELAGGTLWCNSTYEKLLGTPPESIDDAVNWWTTRVHPEDRARVWEVVYAALEGDLESWAVEYRFQGPDGDYRHAVDRCHIVRDERGKPLRVLGAITDVTEQRLAGQKLRDSEEQFRTLVEGTRDYAMFTLDRDGRVESWNTGAEAITGYTNDEINGQPLARFYPAADVAAGRPERHLKLATEFGRYEDEGRRIRKDGMPFWANVILTAHGADDGPLRRFSVIIRDISERRRSEQRVRELTQEAMLAQERERRRLAIVLHDGVGQLLPLVRTKLSLLAVEDDPRRREELIGDIDRLIYEAHDSATALRTELDPPGLRELGLEAATRGLAGEMAQRYGLEVSVEHDDAPKHIAEGLEQVLFRSLRELLVNVSKHSGVSSAEVRLECREGQLWVTVMDRGRGFEAASLDAPKGFGLPSIRERLEYLGGQLFIRSSPDQGTRVILVAPLAPAPLDGEAVPHT